MSDTNKEVLISINPANGQEAGRVKLTSLEALEQVLNTAQQAFETSGWRELLGHQRAEVLRQIADGLLAEKEHLARLQMADNGSLCLSVVAWLIMPLAPFVITPRSVKPWKPRLHRRVAT